MSRPFLDLKFSPMSLTEWVVNILELKEYAVGRGIHCINSYSITEAHRNLKLLKCFQSDQLVCDGKPLSKLVSKPGFETPTVRGPSLMREVILKSPPDVRHYFLGSTEETLRNLINKIHEMNPELSIVGCYSPPFSREIASESNKWLEDIEFSGADIVWVGLGTPKQNFVVNQMALQSPRTFIAVGAAFDFLAGVVSEAPLFLQNSGFEWLYRLYREPRRLWRRYLISNAHFLILALRYRVQNR
jgi:N-acetylglucosaminyldiphosphoundecaprenol N-acetyl-beta-D-mannosaminyltransferase